MICKNNNQSNKNSKKDKHESKGKKKKTKQREMEDFKFNNYHRMNQENDCLKRNKEKI